MPKPTPATSLLQLETDFLALMVEAAKQQYPYVWGGKGDRWWKSATSVIANPFPQEIFDCAGLITTMLYRAGGPDLRFHYGAKQLREQCPAIGTGMRLRFYPGHVALRIPDPVSIVVIEAAGGDHTTLQPTAHGYVRKGPERQSRTRSLLSEGSLSELVKRLMPRLVLPV